MKRRLLIAVLLAFAGTVLGLEVRAHYFGVQELSHVMLGFAALALAVAAWLADRPRTEAFGEWALGLASRGRSVVLGGKAPAKPEGE